jgi:hypothetical protein
MNQTTGVRDSTSPRFQPGRDNDQAVDSVSDLILSCFTVIFIVIMPGFPAILRMIEYFLSNP